MKKYFLTFAAIFSFLISSASGFSPGGPHPEGDWKGVLSISGVSLTIIFHIQKTEQGHYSATMDSPDQGALGIPFSSVSYEEGKLVLEATKIKGSYEGVISEDGQSLNGTWTQLGKSNPLNLKRVDPNEKAPVEVVSEKLVGTWQGALEVQGTSLRLVFHVDKNVDGSAKSTMDSPDQGVTGIFVAKSTEKDGSVVFKIPAIGAEYNGTMKGDKISGTWTQGNQDFLLEVKKVLTSEAPKVNRPQEPKPPYPYEEEDVRYDNPDAGLELAGTLTLPSGKGPFTAALLISGSGPQDRNETLLGHKPFWVIADYLTRQGIAVLRFDDRGIGGSTGTYATATSEDFASDALAGFKYLQSRADINPKMVGLIGHSEGGMIAPMVAAENKEVAFIVLMAGPGIPGEQILMAQGALISRANGVSEDAINANRDLQKTLFDISRNRPDSLEAASLMKNAFQSFKSTLPDSSKEELTDSGIDAQIKQLQSPWFSYFLKHDPRPVLERVTCPVLAINGEKDLQVPPDEDLEAIRTALEKGGNTHFKTIKLPGLNHLFQTAETGSPNEYAKIEETISPLALKTMGDWVLDVAQNR